jgi:hypothetical protein
VKDELPNLLAKTTDVLPNVTKYAFVASQTISFSLKADKHVSFLSPPSRLSSRIPAFPHPRLPAFPPSRIPSLLHSHLSTFHCLSSHILSFRSSSRIPAFLPSRTPAFPPSRLPAFSHSRTHAFLHSRLPAFLPFPVHGDFILTFFEGQRKF